LQRVWCEDGKGRPGGGVARGAGARGEDVS
jgi:hypothetical protein